MTQSELVAGYRSLRQALEKILSTGKARYKKVMKSEKIVGLVKGVWAFCSYYDRREAIKGYDMKSYRNEITHQNNSLIV